MVAKRRKLNNLYSCYSVFNGIILGSTFEGTKHSICHLVCLAKVSWDVVDAASSLVVIVYQYMLLSFVVSWMVLLVDTPVCAT